MKSRSRAYGSMLYGKIRLDIFSTFELFYPKMENRLRISIDWPKFHMIVANPISVIELLIVRFAIVVLLSRTIIMKKRMNMLAYDPVEVNYLETLANTSIIE